MKQPPRKLPPKQTRRGAWAQTWSRNWSTAQASGAAEVERLLEAVERLRPLIEAHAALAEAERRLPDAVFDAMAAAGLFGMLAPRAYGGLELQPLHAMRVWEVVARIDSAAAWSLVAHEGPAGFAAWLPEEGARELYSDGPVLVAGAFLPAGTATRVDGGVRVTARVPFVSSCHRAQWFILPAYELHRSGPRIDAVSGQPVLYGLFIARTEAEILDTCHTLGLRGGGAGEIAVDGILVPDRRTVRIAPLRSAAPGFDGPLYRMFPWPAILGEATVSVGVAAAAVDAVIELGRRKTSAHGNTALREQQLVQHLLGRARARVNAARDTVTAAAEEAYDEAARGLLSWDSKVRLQLAVSFAAESCAEAGRLMHEAAGSPAICLDVCSPAISGTCTP